MSQTLQVTRFDGRHPLGAPATLLWAGPEVTLINHSLLEHHALDRLRVSPRVGTADRFIALPEGGQLQCPDGPWLDGFPQESPSEGLVAWLERTWGVALAALVALILGLAALYHYGLPWLGDQVAERVPLEYEQSLGRHVLQWLDSNEFFQPSELSEDAQAVLQEGFARLGRGLASDPQLQLLFRAAPAIGPNAFALPGGSIVVTDELVDLAEAPEEVLAVLAHELGHVERRHALRQFLQVSITAAVAATLTNDAATLSAAVAGLPALLLQLKYSRDFEAEADEFGFHLLKANDLAPAAFAQIMERLTASSHADEDTDGSYGFLATHPVTQERIAKARAATR